MEIRHRRPFAKPWKIEEQGESFQIRDAAGRILAYVYFEDEPTRRNSAQSLTVGSCFWYMLTCLA